MCVASVKGHKYIWSSHDQRSGFPRLHVGETIKAARKGVAIHDRWWQLRVAFNTVHVCASDLECPYVLLMLSAHTSVEVHSIQPVITYQ